MNRFIKRYRLAFFLIFALPGFSYSSGGTADAIHLPTGLSVNFLAFADQVYLNGYPSNTLLEDAFTGRENFQFAEIAQQCPQFGWIVNSDQVNTLQTAYRILVASSLENIRNNTGDFWDSGKVESDQSVNVIYKGKGLNPDKVYFWKMKTWDNHGVESDYSSIARFKTASHQTEYATARYPLQKEDEYPIVVRKISENLSFVDFGKDAFGRLRLTLPGKIGMNSLTIRFGEGQKEGRIDRNPGGTIRYSEYKLETKGGWNTYVISIRPDKRNTGPNAIKMPDYTGEVTPFRYCEIEGFNDELQKYQVVRETTHYPTDDTDSYFASSDTVLNKVWELSKYSVKGTSFAGIYVDGDRERIPYEADALINQLGQYGVAREYSMARYSQEYLLFHATWPTEWILQSVLIAWNDYLYTGDKTALEHNYEALKAKTLISLSDEPGFISSQTGKVTPELLESIHLNSKLRDVVDWPHSGGLGLGKNEPGETDGFVFKDVNTVVNAYHYRALVIMAQVSGALGKDAESKTYTQQAEKSKKAFNSLLLDKKRKIYVDGIGTSHSSLHANMFPVAFGLAPDNCIKGIDQFIQSRGMACSVYGSQFLLDAVYDSNNSTYGLDLLTSTTDRSWYNMIRCGSTITMEAWDNKYKPNQDWNHAWGAAPANIIPRKLMGIEPLLPGFRKIRIKPQPASLEYAEIKCPTIRGDVLVSFKNKPGKSFLLKTTIPANTTAVVYLPYWSESQKVTMDGKMALYYREGNFLLVDRVGSGSHTFEVIK